MAGCPIYFSLVLSNNKVFFKHDWLSWILLAPLEYYYFSQSTTILLEHMHAILHECLHAALPKCIPVILPECIHAVLPKRMPAILFECMHTTLSECMPPTFSECMHATFSMQLFLSACKRPFLSAYMQLFPSECIRFTWYYSLSKYYYFFPSTMELLVFQSVCMRPTWRST